MKKLNLKLRLNQQKEKLLLEPKLRRKNLNKLQKRSNNNLKRKNQLKRQTSKLRPKNKRKRKSNLLLQ
jgi:hypothetical protein